MAKRKNPILPPLKELEQVVRNLHAALVRAPFDLYDSDCDDSDLLGEAQKTLYERMMHDYVAACLEDEALVDELTDDLPDGRDSYSDYDIENYVAETMEGSFQDEHGRDPSGLDPQHYWDELVAIEPDLLDCCFVTLTVGADGEGKDFGAQTGDNSYTGSAYGYPHWAVVNIHLGDKPKDVARDIQNQISELWHGSNY